LFFRATFSLSQLCFSSSSSVRSISSSEMVAVPENRFYEIFNSVEHFLDKFLPVNFEQSFNET
jgi:hypothetical protein